MSADQASVISSTKASPIIPPKPNRLPAPTLFVGPPSRNASQLSIARLQADAAGKTSRIPLERQKSALSRPYNLDPGPNNNINGGGNDAKPSTKEGPSTHPALKKPSDRSIDAKWKEMQSTLDEVELTAQSSTHVFGARHAAALDDLRRAQVELARAWGRGNEDGKAAIARSEAQDVNVNGFQVAEEIAADRMQKSRKRADTESSQASTLLSKEGAESEGGSGRSERSRLEDETAADIKLASERRAANEAYFKKVDGGVKEVVAKLEVVAEAMRAVESESRSLWSASERGSRESGRERGEGGAEVANAGDG